MEQIFLLEILVDRVTIFPNEGEDDNTEKKLIVKIKFGPKTQFIIKERQIVANDTIKDDINECTEDGRNQWSRIIRIGKSYLFPAFPDTVMTTLSKFPLEIEVWNDDENEVEIFVGVGTMHWHSDFYYMLKKSAESTCVPVEPLTLKQTTPLYAECCCRICGEITFVIRLTALGASITTEFQQLMRDPHTFVFRTDRAPSVYQCSRIEGDDPNFTIIGSLYESVTLEDPCFGRGVIEVCTEAQSCTNAPTDGLQICKHKKIKDPNKPDRVRMGDIRGPCGNTNCPLAHKVKNYIRNLESYKKETGGVNYPPKNIEDLKVCGKCVCKDDRYHRDTCPTKQPGGDDEGYTVCKNCGGVTVAGDTCAQKVKKLTDYSVHYAFSGTTATDFNDILRKTTEFPIIEEVAGCTSPLIRSASDSELKSSVSRNRAEQNTMMLIKALTETASMMGCGCPPETDLPEITKPLAKCSCPPAPKITENLPKHIEQAKNRRVQKMVVMQVTANPSAVTTTVDCECPPALACTVPPKPSGQVKLALGPDKYDGRPLPPLVDPGTCATMKDCICNPSKVKMTAPCKAPNCECMEKMANRKSRKEHKEYCPRFKHKLACPVNAMLIAEEESKEGGSEDEEAVASNKKEKEEVPLEPYGLPPVKLGPCPVIGRPCTVPDGFARMYKVGKMPPGPPSYGPAGKVCCSKEFTRIKAALKAIMQNEKGSDFRCVNAFNKSVDKRCCDDEDKPSTMTHSCCGAHKMALREKYKDILEKKQ